MGKKSFTSFIIVWIGQLFSGLGSGMTTFALGVTVFKETGSIFFFSMIIAASFGPSILLNPIGGVLADRIDRRILIAGGDIGSGLCIFVLMLSVVIGNSSLALIFTTIIMSSVFNSLQSPAYKSAATDLLTEDQYSKAGGLMQLASSAQHLVSPFIAGLLLSTCGLTIILAIDVLTFSTAIFAVMAMGKPLICNRNEYFKSIAEDLKESIQILKNYPGIYQIIFLLSFITFCVGFLQTLLGPMILSFENEKVLGTIQSISAIGMLFSSLFISFFKSRFKQSTILSVSLILSGIFFSSMGLRANTVIITISGFLFFCTLPLINTSVDVLIRKTIPNFSQGRIWSLISVITQSGYIISYFISGLLAEKFFTPLLLKGGALSNTLGEVIGIGPGRGIAFFIILSGLGVFSAGIVSLRLNSIHKLG